MNCNHNAQCSCSLVGSGRNVFVFKYDPAIKRELEQIAIFDRELVLLKDISFLIWSFGVPVL